jgi:hypothetical protein
MDVPKGLEARLVRQADVQKHDVRPLLGKQLQPLGSGRGRQHRKPVLSKDLAELMESRKLVIND